ncbi:MAG TPA: universal stress protein [Pyrinomonadaceae bacterium]|nr:universal stress protein [Pyrinomonadaceae bacterium]
MKVLLAVDSITTLDILINEMSARSWPLGTEARVLSIIDDADVLLKVWGEEGHGLSALRREMHRRGAQISALAVERLRKIGISSQVVIMSGDPEFLISFAARSWPADLILIRAHNRKDLRSRLLGGVAKSVVKSAPCSVEVVRARAQADVNNAQGGFRVLLATDGSRASIAASRAIAEMTWPEDTEIRVVSVVNPLIYSFEELGVTGDQSTDYAHRAIGDAVQLLRDAPVRISAEVIAGSAARQIIARAKHWGADLIVLGTNERRGLSRWLFGSISAAVANRAHCSVRVIREKDVLLAGNSLQERFTFSSGAAESTNELQASRKAA